MTINLQLSGLQPAPATDFLQRQHFGYEKGMDARQVYEQNRGMWVLGRRAYQEQYATFSFDNLVVAVVAIDSIRSEGLEHARLRPNGRPRQYLEGRVLRKGDPAHDLLIGRVTPSNHNPVTYTDDPAGEARACACGCGSPIPTSRTYVPGHDQRAVHDRISRQWGSTLGFIRWFDATYSTAQQG